MAGMAYIGGDGRRGSKQRQRREKPICVALEQHTTARNTVMIIIIVAVQHIFALQLQISLCVRCVPMV